MILVSCAAAETIVNPVAKYVFKMPQKDSQAVTWIYRTMKEKGITKIAVLSSNDGFGAAGKKQLEDSAPDEGIEILVNEVYDKQATDLTDVLTKVKGNASVQAVVNWSIVPAQSIVAKNMKQLGLDVPLFQSHGFGNLKYVQQAGVAAEGTLFPAGRLLVVDELARQPSAEKCSRPTRRTTRPVTRKTSAPSAGMPMTPLMVLVEGSRRPAARSGEGPRRHREPQGLRRHGRRVQLLRHRPHRARPERLRDADREGRQVRHLQEIARNMPAECEAQRPGGSADRGFCLEAQPMEHGSLALQYLLSGITKGSIYAVVAIGFNLIYSTTGIINFAQGEFVMLGGMVAVTLAHFVPLPVAVAGAVVIVALVGCLLELVLFRRLQRHSVLHLIIITIGLSIVIQEAALHIWDEKVRSLPYFTGNEVSSVRFLGAAISPQVLVGAGHRGRWWCWACTSSFATPCGAGPCGPAPPIPMPPCSPASTSATCARSPLA